MINLSEIIEQINSEFRVDKYGKTFVSIRGASRLADISQGGLSDTLKSGVQQNPTALAKYLKEQGFDYVQQNLCSKKGIPDIALAVILEYYGYECQPRYRTEQAKACCRAFRSIGIRTWIQTELKWKAKSQAEAESELLDKVIQLLTSKKQVNTEAKFLTSFYDILYRKRGGEWTDRDRNDRPGCVGGWTNEIIYDRLPGGKSLKSVKAALKAAQKMEGGRMHHFLSTIGQNDLQLMFNTLQTVDKLTPDGDWGKFMRCLAKALPNGEPLQLSLLDLIDEANDNWEEAV